MTQEQIWESVLAQIKLNVSSANFATWFANTKISEIQGGVLTISVPNSFSKEETIFCTVSSFELQFMIISIS